MLSYYDLIYIFHFLIIGPLLAYVGYYKEKVDGKILDAVMWLGLFVTVYHFYKFVSIKMMQYKTI